MSAKVTIAWCLLSTALAVLLVLQVQENRKVKRRLETVQLQVEDLDAARKAADAHVQEARNEALKLRGENVALETEAAAARFAQTNSVAAASPSSKRSEPGTESTAPAAGSPNPGSMLKEMLKDPSMRKMVEQQQKVMIGMMFEPLIKELDLTPEKQEQFRQMLLDRQMQNVQQAGALFEGGSTNRAAASADLAAANKAREEEIRSFLGDDNYTKYQDYSQTIGERMMLNQFSQQTKLDPAQTEQLLSIMQEEKKAAFGHDPNLGTPNQGIDLLQSTDAAERFFSQQEAANSQVIERARSVLSPEQLDSFASFQTNQLRMQRMAMEMARKMMQPDSKTAPAPTP